MHRQGFSLCSIGTSASGRPYLVMEYVEGVPIDRWCDERDLSLEQRVRLFLEVTAAVDIDGMDTDPAVTLTTLSAADPSAANPPGQPTLVSPSTKHATLRPGTDALTLPPYSFTVVLFDKA